LKTFFDPNLVNEGAQRSVFEGIGHDVINLDTRFARLKKMLVVPNPVGSKPLLVNEKTGDIDMGNLGQPTHPQAE